jgi:predicted DCC family thiol-disulfide oxidoreductase YuxK
METDVTVESRERSIPKELSPYFPLIVFDGTCGLCNRLSGWILDHQSENPERQMFVVGGESTFGKALLQDIGVEKLAESTILFLTPDGILTKMDASHAIWRRLRFPYSLIPLLYGWLPRTVLNSLYDRIAANRTRKVCTLKDREWRERYARFVLDDLPYPKTNS